MKRTAKIIRYNEDKSIAICVDIESAETILEYINRNSSHRKKFNYIVEIILNRLKNRDVYEKEEIDENCKGVTAMKFFKGRSNDRIYCKEMTMADKTFVIITSELFEKKKSQKLNQKLRNIIKKVAGYEYEIIR